MKMLGDKESFNISSTARRRSRNGSYVILYIGLGLISLITLFPIIWILITSVKPTIDIPAYPPKIMFQPTLEHYDRAFSRSGFFSSFLDSTLIAVVVMLLSVTLGSMCAYSLARFNTGGKNFRFWILSQRMFPPVAMILPLYILMRRLHLLDTYFALIITHTVINLPFTVWLMRGFIIDLPKEIDEAALIDGCSIWQVFWRIIIPVVKPGLVAAAIFALITSWNEFLFAMILTGGVVKTVPLLASEVITDKEVLWGPMSAIGTMAAIPIIIFTLFVQKYIVRGLSYGAVK
jgi:multiple sugar transport system permease protein